MNHHDLDLRDDRPTTHRPGSPGHAQPPIGMITHLAFALSRYVHHLRQEGMHVPAQIDDFTAFLMDCVKARQEPPPMDDQCRPSDYGRMADRLLVTKAEAAEQLAVSVRTIERLVAAGRLPLVHVEGAARLRVADIEAYVHDLAPGRTSRRGSGGDP